jgi:mannosylglycerate hydrolase
MAYLRDGYGNAAGLPTADPVRFTSEVLRLRDSLQPYSASAASQGGQGGHVLLMQGTDHQEPPPNTPLAIAFANQHLERDTIIHSTLPAYLEALRLHLQQISAKLPTITGELRSPKRFHLLPGVLSSRMWIKQYNHACETLLEKWVEPFTTWASLLQPAVVNETGLLPVFPNPFLENTARLSARPGVC